MSFRTTRATQRHLFTALGILVAVTGCGDDEDGSSTSASGTGSGGGGASSSSSTTTALASTSPASTSDASSSASGDGGNGGDGGSGAGSQGGGGSGSGGSPEIERPQAGVLECDPIHEIADGTCSMQMETCEPGEIPDLIEGCAPVGVAACDAQFLEDGVCLASRTLCDDGTFPVPSEGCVLVDGDVGCGDGTWGNITEQAGDVHVDPASLVPSPTGSRLAPYLTVEAALDAVDDGGRIVLAAGSYDEPILIESSVNVIGRCPSLVELVGETDHDVPLVTTPSTAVRVAGAGEVSFSGVRFAGPGVGLIVEDSDVTLTGVEVEAVGRGIVVANDGSVDGEHVWVHDVQTNPDGTRGDAVIAYAGAAATFRRSAFAGSTTAAMVSFGGTMTLEDVLVEGTLPNGGDFGLAVYADGAGTISATDVVLSGNYQQVGAYEGSEMALTRLVIVDATDPGYGLGVVVQNDANVDMTSSILRGNVAGGVALFTASMTSSGNLIQANSGSSFETDGFLIYDGSTLSSIGDVVLEHAGQGYITFVVSEDATNLVTIRRGLIEGQRGIAGSLLYGQGITLNGGSGAQVTDTVIRGNHDLGIYVGDFNQGGSLPSALTIETSRIEGTLPGEDEGAINGIALQAVGAAEVIADRTLFLDSHGAGLHVAGASVELVACVIEGIEDNTVSAGDVGISSLEGGDAILVQGVSAEGDPLAPDGFDGGLVVTDSWIDGADRAAALVHGASATFTGTRLGGATYGVVVQADGEADLEGSLVEDIDEEAPGDDLAVP